MLANVLFFNQLESLFPALSCYFNQVNARSFGTTTDAAPHVKQYADTLINSYGKLCSSISSGYLGAMRFSIRYRKAKIGSPYKRQYFEECNPTGLK